MCSEIPFLDISLLISNLPDTEGLNYKLRNFEEVRIRTIIVKTYFFDLRNNSKNTKKEQFYFFVFVKFER